MSYASETRVTISGYLVGNIWWPNAECSKPLNYDLTREADRCDTRELRHHVLRATNDGDFQSAVIAQGELTVETRRVIGSTLVRRTRTWPLSHFPSIADCLHSDPDWWPADSYSDDE